MALNAVMERDSENPTPTLDKEPFFVLLAYGRKNAQNRKTHASFQGIRSPNSLNILCWT